MILQIILVTFGTLAEEGHSDNRILLVDQLIRSSLTGYDYRQFRNIVNTSNNSLEIISADCEKTTDSTHLCIASYARKRDLESSRARIDIKQFAIKINMSENGEYIKKGKPYFVDCQYRITESRKGLKLYFREKQGSSHTELDCEKPSLLDNPDRRLSRIDDQATLSCPGERIAFVSRKGQMATLDALMCEPSYLQWFVDVRDNLVDRAGEYGRRFLDAVRGRP